MTTKRQTVEEAEQRVRRQLEACWADRGTNEEHNPANCHYVIRDLDALIAAVRAEGQGVRRMTLPLTIDCDDCGEVVTIPRTGTATCGCAGVTWSLTTAKKGA